MPFPYRHILIIGATSGIGRGLADKFVEEGLKVTVVGRRESLLKQFVQQNSQRDVDSVIFDISKAHDVSSFVANVTRKHRDIDCVVLSAGQQQPIQLLKDAQSNAKLADDLSVNFLSIARLSLAFLPFLQEKQRSCLLFLGSQVAFVPVATSPGYSASKAALASFVVCLREQLKASRASTRIIDLWPGVVQTELLDYLGEEKGRWIGMPLEAFVLQAWHALVDTDSDNLIIGDGPAPLQKLQAFSEDRMSYAASLADIMRSLA